MISTPAMAFNESPYPSGGGGGGKEI